MAPFSSKVTYTVTGSPRKAAAVPSQRLPASTADAVPAAPAAALLTASTTAALVSVAPVMASTSSPRVSGTLLPMNRDVKASSAHFWPMPCV